MLNFEFSEEHKMIQNTVREFANKEVKPLAEDFDRSPEFLTKEFLKLFKKMGDLGFYGLMFPEEYEGIGDGLDVLGASIVHRELGKVSAGTASSYMPQIIVGGVIMSRFCSEDQKKKYLPDLAAGEKIVCLGVTEPNAGSDVSAIQTDFYLDGDEYVLNGSKQFITNAPVADLFYVLAKDKEDGEHCGFLIEKGTKGLAVGPHLDKMGHRASPTSEVFMDDCRIPKENIIGEKGKGVTQSLMGIEMERIMCASENVGIAEAALAESIKYSKERISFGKPICKHQAVQGLLAEMATGVKTGEAMLYYAIWDFLKNKDVPKKFPSLATSIVKYYTGQMVERVTSHAVQVHGGYGYIKEYPVERFMRDSKLFQIGGGTSQIQEMLIARNLLA